MKAIKSLFLIAIMAIISFSCENDNQTSDSLSLDNLKLETNVDFSSARYSIKNDGVAKLSSEITNTIFDVNNSNNIKGFSINSNVTDLNVTILNSHAIAAREGKPCKTESTKCYSKDCVSDTITKILGDGKRDVIIEYDRGLTSVTISWTYQDC